jgi:BirA family biotin operon repressor/biotin-[acetyl-CoA-carboxylase] ligase
VTELRADDLQSRLAGCTLAQRLDLRGVVGSTNDEARVLGRAGAGHGTVVVAEGQTRGRGRRERRWDSPVGVGIYMSVLLRPPREAQQQYGAGVQLAGGIAVAETIAPALPAPVELLWPNDVVCTGLKMAGVLVEGESTGRGLDFLVCGIGLNVNQLASDIDPGLRGLAGSMHIIGGTRYDRSDLLVRLLFSLESWEQVARAGDGQSLADRFVALSPSSTGCRTQVRTTEGIVEGESAGVTAAGGLLLNTPGGAREIVVGELERVWRRR